MKNVDLKKTGWHALYYKFIFNKELPIAFCDYFWELVAIIAFIPIVLPIVLIYKLLTFIFKKQEENRKQKTLTPEQKEQNRKITKVFVFIGKTIYYTFIGIIILGLVYSLYSIRAKFSWDGLFEIIGIFTVFLGLVYLIVTGIIKFVNSDFVEICVAKFKSYKERTCPKINWN